MRKEQRRRYYERARDRERGLEAMKGDNDTTVDNIEDKKEDESSLQEDQEEETRTCNEEMSEFHEQPKPLIEKKVDWGRNIFGHSLDVVNIVNITICVSS